MNTDSMSSAGSFASEFETLVKKQVDSIKLGNIVTGTVVNIGKEMVTIDIGFKSEGVVPTQQFQGIDGKIDVKVGDETEVFILQLENEQGQVVLSREKAMQKRVWEHVEQTFAEGALVTGKVMQKVKGGLQVDIGIPAFLPGSQVDIRPHRNLDKFLGEVYDFKVLKITKDKGNIVVSRRAVLLSERSQLREETLKVIQEGVVMEGTVKNITDYGVFIDLGGIDGLLHITDISWGRVNHPAEKLNVGDKVPVVVLKYDEENERVSLGMKQLKEDPWLHVDERYPIGSRVVGKVFSIVDYGAFVELEDGVEGLIHVSDMSWTKKSKHPSKIVSEKQMVEVQVLGIDHQERRISLGMKQLTTNPWNELAKLHPVGSIVTGKVRSITEFGIFVGIEDGIDGLVHVSDFSWTKRIKEPKEISELYKKGTEITAKVLEIDVENERLSLGIKQLEEDPWEKISMRYPVGSRVKGKVASIADFGVFVELEEGVEGLIHTSQLGLNKEDNVKDNFKIGDEVESEVINIDRDEHRISLSISIIKNREEHNMSNFSDDGAGMAVTFGDLLRQAKDEK
ncbi:MAG: 30S ribosomal protein S1 [Bdellovibrionota bacterium]|nr:30S ribosomal protein S1 [Pseudomonadota bacterium]MDY6089799.1 30S ribosomal protein S1 [Bdellovibrionota bacterium]